MKKNGDKKHTYSLEIRNSKVRVYIDNLPHIVFDIQSFIGMDSYREFNGLYGIDLSFKKGKIKLECEDRQIWGEVLKLINDKL